MMVPVTMRLLRAALVTTLLLPLTTAYYTVSTQVKVIRFVLLRHKLRRVCCNLSQVGISTAKMGTFPNNNNKYQQAFQLAVQAMQHTRGTNRYLTFFCGALLSDTDDLDDE